MAIALRHILAAAGPNTIVSNATSCSEITTSKYPRTAWGVPYIHVAFECTAAVAAGIEAALKAQGRQDVNVIAIAGDGGTYDIGLQALSGMVERGHNVLYVCYDNECYANTGIQRSSATPYGAWTTTSPVGSAASGNMRGKKPIAQIIAAHGAPYVATASVAWPADLEAKVKKALSIKGPKFMLVHSPCPPAWKFDSNRTIEIARMAVECGAFVLCEIENVDGKQKLTISREPTGRPVAEYLKAQGRFSHLKEEEIAEIAARIKRDWGIWKAESEQRHAQQFR
ncbi:MAG: thiamine pyrophosphate-dependent enzyme [Candidatus Aenigmatarchaeota archaeon]